MTELGKVFDSLNGMSLLQLLIAFVACIAYTLAQGGLVANRSRGIATVTAALAAVAFVFLSDTWAHSAVLVAVAVAGIGSFVAMAWLLGRMFGPAHSTAPVTDDMLIAEPDTAAARAGARSRPRRRAVTSST